MKMVNTAIFTRIGISPSCGPSDTTVDLISGPCFTERFSFIALFRVLKNIRDNSEHCVFEHHIF